MKKKVQVLYRRLRAVAAGGPGGPDDVLLLSNGTDGLLLVDGTSFLKLASSS
jgi:hypothetical protein